MFFGAWTQVDLNRSPNWRPAAPVEGAEAIGGADVGQALARLPDGVLDSWYTGCTQDGTLIGNLTGASTFAARFWSHCGRLLLCASAVKRFVPANRMEPLFYVQVMLAPEATSSQCFVTRRKSCLA